MNAPRMAPEHDYRPTPVSCRPFVPLRLDAKRSTLVDLALGTVTHPQRVARDLTPELPPSGVVGKRGRMPGTNTHCLHGHEYSEANTRMDGNTRVCRTCAIEKDRRHRARRKATRAELATEACAAG